MKRIWGSALAAALLAGLPACQGGGNDGTGEAANDKVVTDRPAPALSDPASPTPVGTDVGTISRDTSAGRVADDSVAVPRR